MTSFRGLKRQPEGSVTGLSLIADERGKSLGQKTYDTLLDKLIRREIPVGSVLQDRKIAEMLDISRTPVRDALNRLENEGFVTRLSGGALMVKEFSTRELIETLHVRQVLEMESIRLATGRIPLAELDEIEAAIKLILAADAPDSEDNWTVDSRFHGLIGHYSGNAVLAKHISDLRLKTHMFNLSWVPERYPVGNREHLVMIEALKRGDGEAARDAMQAHIENVKRSIIEKLQTN